MKVATLEPLARAMGFQGFRILGLKVLGYRA